MDRERERLAKGILDRLLDLPADAREASLAEACNGDAALRGEVEWLLEHEEEGLGDFLRQPVGAAFLAVLGDRTAVPPGTSVGPYRIVGRLGEGGNGVVFLAEREGADFVQRVALKLLRPSADSESTRQRFLAERRLLARLEHPNIARLIDGGLAGDSTPFLVMEYVAGRPITEYCDRRRLSVRERLRLFLPVCDAVEHVHRHLALHRDLKPTNILVTDDAQPKLLDFGIAKALRTVGEVGEAGEATETTAGVLTPNYASPEHLRGESLTTASDVYSLGVLLYQLLTGRHPHDRRGFSANELRRRLGDDSPPAPSSVVGAVPNATSGEEAPSIVELAASRATTPTRLRRQLAGDLDTVVLTAIASEPAARYSSVDRLREDLERHLDGRPILARRPSWSYRAAKLARRHRVATVATAAAGASLALLAVLTGIFAVRMASERQAARGEQAKAEQVTRLLVEALRSASPMEAGRPAETVRQVLDGMATRVGSDPTVEPLVRAAVLHNLGYTNAGLGRFDEALEQLEAALALRRRAADPHPREIAESLLLIGGIQGDLGELAAAEAATREAIELLRRAFDRRPHPELAAALHALGLIHWEKGELDRAEEIAENALEMRRRLLGEAHTETAASLDLLGRIHRRRGDGASAERRLRQALEIRRRSLGERHPEVAASLNNLGVLYDHFGEYAAAEPLLREAVEIRRAVLGDSHPHTGHALANLGKTLHQRGALAEAEEVLDEALALARRTLGDDNLFVAVARNNLAAVVVERGGYERAEALHRENLALLTRLLGQRHLYAALTRNNLAWSLQEQGRFDVAEALHRRALDELLELADIQSPEIAQVRNNLAWLAFRRGHYEEAERGLVENLALRRQSLGDEHPDVARTLTNLATLWVTTGEDAKGEEAARRALGIYATTLDPGDWRLAESRSVLGAALAGQGQGATGRAMLRTAVETLAAVKGTEAFATRWAMTRLGETGAADARLGEAADHGH